MKRKKRLFAIIAMGLMIFNLTEVKAQKNENQATFEVSLQQRAPSYYENEKDGWVITNEIQQWKPSETAIIICDMWNQHWCKGAAHWNRQKCR